MRTAGQGLLGLSIEVLLLVALGSDELPDRVEEEVLGYEDRRLG